MADTIKNISLNISDVINIYTHPDIIAAGINVGDKIIVTNVGGGRFKLFSGANQPTAQDGFIWCYPRDEKINATGDTGAWAYGAQYNTELNVRKAE